MNDDSLEFDQYLNIIRPIYHFTYLLQLSLFFPASYLWLTDVSGICSDDEQQSFGHHKMRNIKRYGESRQQRCPVGMLAVRSRDPLFLFFYTFVKLFEDLLFIYKNEDEYSSENVVIDTSLMVFSCFIDNIISMEIFFRLSLSLELDPSINKSE